MSIFINQQKKTKSISLASNKSLRNWATKIKKQFHQKFAFSFSFHTHISAISIKEFSFLSPTCSVDDFLIEQIHQTAYSLKPNDTNTWNYYSTPLNENSERNNNHLNVETRTNKSVCIMNIFTQFFFDRGWKFTVK